MKFILNGDNLILQDEIEKNSATINYLFADVEKDSSWDNLTINAVVTKLNEKSGYYRAVIGNRVSIDVFKQGIYTIGFVGFTVENNVKVFQKTTNLVEVYYNPSAGEIEIKNEYIPSASEWELYIRQIEELVADIDYNDLDNKPKINNVELIGNKTLAELGFIPLERLAAYLYKVSFDTIPEEKEIDTVIGGCTSYVKDGKLYRNLDWNYDENNSFLVQCKGFKGMAFINGLTDENMDKDLIGQLPYHLVDGVNEDGIMVSTHILYNDWDWHGAGEKNIPLHKLPYIILNEVKSIDELSTKLANVLNNIKVSQALEEAQYLAQFIVTDGVTTYAILPPTSSTGSYVIEDITSNPKLTNFRWVNSEIVVRTDLQRRPNGVERWNLIPTSLENLRFTKAYEEPTRLSEFIGINETTKDSTDEELTAIYNLARQEYLRRQRDGKLWQTMHSIVYSNKGIEELYIQENWERSYVFPVDVPRKTSDLINDSDFVSDSNYVHTDNNFTDEKDNKLAELENYDDTEIKENISALGEVVASHTSDIEALDDALSALETTVDEHTTDIQELDNAIDTLENTVSGHTTDIQELNNAVGELDNAVDELETEKQDITDNNLQTTNKNIVPAINEINSKVNNNINNIADINSKIPTQASESNKLADKDFVNSTTQTLTANFRGNWNNWASVPTNPEDYPEDFGGVKTPSTNDYMVVGDASDYPSETLEGTWRFKYSGNWETVGKNGWRKEYQVNETPLTAAQLAAINSGITNTLVALITANRDNIAQILLDLVDYVKNTDYATSSKAGVIKTSGAVGTQGNTTTGVLSAATRTFAQYENDNNDLFVGKGTFENVLTGKGLVKSITISSDSTDDNVATPKSVYDYIESLDIEEVAF